VLRVLNIDVAPGAAFPVQLIQSAAAIEYLTKEIGIKPSQIILGGDSAGGNLALAILSQILHPRNDVPSISLGNEKFKGVVLSSPWVTFDQTAPAFKINAKKDILYGPVLKKWSDAFVGAAPRDNFTYPLDAAPEWWSDLPADETLVLAGGNELLVDDIKDFTDKLKVFNITIFFYARG
jgi:acetyl esterase/lipase